jgi:hypothetical protein
MGIGEHAVTTFFHPQYSVFGGLDTPPFLALFNFYLFRHLLYSFYFVIFIISLIPFALHVVSNRLPFIFCSSFPLYWVIILWGALKEFCLTFVTVPTCLLYNSEIPRDLG